MQHFFDGADFEAAVFGRAASGHLFRRFGRNLTTCGEDINRFVQSCEVEYPPTQIGHCLHHQVWRHLESLDINPNGLVFLPSTDTSIDLYGIDGLFYLPALFPHFVSVDAFNTDSRNLRLQKEKWIDSCLSQKYSEWDYQSDLFLFKKGMIKWDADRRKCLEKSLVLLPPPDYRFYSSTEGRWGNHLTLTPGDVQMYETRRQFARLVAGYFAKVAKASSHENMALLSH
ncbi:MAG: hypothetical protein AAB837_01415 [Patescibacteria group bacterium]